MCTSFRAEDPARIQRFLVTFVRPFMRSPAQGATTSVCVASAPGLERVTGQYFVNSRPRSSSKRNYDETAAARLWQVSGDHRSPLYATSYPTFSSGRLSHSRPFPDYDA